MISENRISPNYQARAIADLVPGNLFFVYMAQTFKPYLLLEDDQGRHIAALSDDFLMARVGPSVNSNQVVYALSQEWRFRLASALPQEIGNPANDLNKLGKITVCNGLRAMTVNIGDDDLYLLDIDKLSPADDTGLFSHKGFYSDWAIETRSDASEPWTELFSNTRAKE